MKLFANYLFILKNFTDFVTRSHRNVKFSLKIRPAKMACFGRMVLPFAPHFLFNLPIRKSRSSSHKDPDRVFRVRDRIHSRVFIMRHGHAAGVLSLVVALGLSIPSLGADGKLDLRARDRANDLSQVEVRLEGGGTLKVAEKGGPRSLAMRVIGELSYQEKRLPSPDDTLRSARHYQRSQATITIDKAESKPALAETRRLIGIQAGARGATLFCPDAPLTRDELELIEVPFNSLLLDGLLPDQAVAIGESWKQSPEVMSRLLILDAVSSTDVESMLKEIDKKGRAVVQVAGSVAGAIEGVATEIDIKCQYLADLERHRIVSLAANIKETRPIGHIGPGLAVVAKLQMTVKPLAESTELSGDALAKRSFELTPAAEKLAYQPGAGMPKLLYDRRWHLIKETSELTVLRFVDRGELVAQCNLVGRTNTDGGKAVTLGKFQTEIEKALGQSFGRFLEASEDTLASGQRVLRVKIAGKASELPIQWNYFRVEGKDGRSMTFAFMLETDLLDRFGDADKSLVEGLTFPEPATAAASKLNLSR